MHGQSLGSWQGQQLQGTPVCAHRKPLARNRNDRCRLTVVSADGPGPQKRRNGNWLDLAVQKKKQQATEEVDFTIDDINPYSIGRRSRQVIPPSSTPAQSAMPSSKPAKGHLSPREIN